MRKIKEVLRLRFELGLGQRAIARACSISQSTVHEYLNRAAEEPSSASRVDTFAYGALGEADRTEHRAALCEDLGREAASGDGLSIVFGHHPTGRKVFSGQDGSGRRSRTTDRSLPLPEREIDPEKLARPTATHRITFISSSASARQHSWR
jgi:transcriptional regulator with XRE-family HTH domain